MTITLILIALTIFASGLFIGLLVGWELRRAPIINDRNQ